MMSIFNIGQKFDNVSGKEMDLLEAARSGNIKEAEKILSSRSRKSSGGALSALARHLMKSVNVNCSDKSGATPLHLAALYGHKDLVVLLLQCEAVGNIVDSRGCTPLHLAAWSGNAEICRILLTSGVSPPHITSQNCDGDTALHCASQYGNSSAVAILLQNSADISICNLKDESPLDLAAQYGRLEALQELLKHSLIVGRPTMTQSPLHLAARNGHRKVCEALLNAGFDINVKTKAGTSLHEAAFYCKPDVVRLLLDKDIHVDEVNAKNKTALDLVIGHPPHQTQYANVADLILAHIKKKTEEKSPKPVPKPRIQLSPKAEPNRPDSEHLYSKSKKVKALPEIPHCHDSVADFEANLEDKPPPLPPRSVSLLKPERDKPPVPPPPTAETMGDGYLPMNSVAQGQLKPPASLESTGHKSLFSPAKPPRKKNVPKQEVTTTEPAISQTKSQSDLQADKAHPRLVDNASNQHVDVGGMGNVSPKENEVRSSETEKVDRKGDNSSSVCDISAAPKQSNAVIGSEIIVNDKSVIQSINVDGSVASDRVQETKPLVEGGHVKCEAADKDKIGAGKKNSESENAPDNVVAKNKIPGDLKCDQNGNQTNLPTSKIDMKSSETGQSGSNVDLSQTKSNSISETSDTVNIEPTSANSEASEDDVFTEKMTTSFESFDSSSSRLSKPQSLELDERRTSRSSCDVPLSPTGYPQPPTPDFPPPSPDTAIFGIQQKIGSINKRHSKDMETITEASFLGPAVSLDGEVKTDTTTKLQKSECLLGENICQSISLRQEQSTLSVHETIEEQPEGSENNSPDNEKCKEKFLQETKNMGTGVVSLVSKEKCDEMDVQSATISDEKTKIKTEEKTLGDPEMDQSEKLDVATKTDVKAEKSGLSVETEDLRIKIKPRSKDGVMIETEEKTLDDPEIIHSESSDDKAKTVSHQMKAEKSGLSEEIDLSVAMLKPKSREKSLSSKSSSEDEGETTTRDPDMKIYADLLKGSAPGGSRKVASQIYENVVFKHRTSHSTLQSVPASVITFHPLMEEDAIDTDKLMEAIESVTTAKPTTYSASQGHTEGGFDDNEQWAEISNIMASFGAAVTRESVFIRDYQDAFTTLLAGGNKIQSVEDWLEGLGLSHYENTLVANGFDDTDFLGSKIMDEQDLEVIGISVPEHRKKMIESAKSLPQMKPIDQDNPPGTVEQWLTSLHLSDYLSTFMSNKYDILGRVRNLWEHELTTVLDISSLGHRKRILASLGERQTPDRSEFSSVRRKTDLADLATVEELPSRFSDINLYKDYTKVKPISSSEEDAKRSSQSSIPQFDSSEDDNVFHREGRQIRDSSIHLRPPYLAHTCSPIKTWRHRPEILIKGCCNYTAQYLGSTLVQEPLAGAESTRGGITKLKKSVDVIAKIPLIILSISYKGVKFIDAKSKKVICDHEIGNIFCACQDGDSLNFFAYITRDVRSMHHYCHVFNVRNSEHAREIILTLGEAFEIAYQMALKEKAEVEAVAFEQKLNQTASDKEDCNSVSSRTSSNTV